MALKIITLKDKEKTMEVVEGAKFVIADRRLYLTADRKSVVEHGDLKAAFLYATPGTRIPLEAAYAFGLLPRPKPKPQKKAMPTSKNKVAPKSKNK